MKILLAEDDMLSRLLMQRMLQSFGYEVVVAEDGRRAVEILTQPDGPRLALVDWMMPELDGVGVCREMRSRDHDMAYVYILLLTSKQNSEDIVAGLEAGADDYITKPCQPAELKARLHTGRRIISLEQNLVDAREEMRFRATRDALTGLWNRASILSMAGTELKRTNRRRPVSILLCDVDHFKGINDTYGHLVGDQVLKEVATRILSSVRTYDAVGRYGGEEFLAVLGDCEPRNLAPRAEQIRSAIASAPIRVAGKDLFVSISIGGVSCMLEETDVPFERLLARADAALYRAKRDGRNRSIMADCGSVSQAALHSACN